MADRKSAFTEYQNELRVREREEYRENKENTKSLFLQLLDENRFQLTYLTKFYQFAKRVIADSRYKNCEEREEVF